MSKHTPTPWILDLEKGQILDTNGNPVCRATMLQNAADQLVRIVRAVNAHKDLVGELTDLVSIIDALRPTLEKEGNELLRQIIDRANGARAALAKARGAGSEDD